MKEHPALKFSLFSGCLLAGLALVWGGSFFFAEIALRELPPLTLAFYRVLWATPVLLFVVWFKRIQWPRGIKVWLSYLVMGVLNNALPFSLIFWGQTHIESGLAAILNSTTAIFGVIVAGIFLIDERLTCRKVVGIILGFGGVVILIGFRELNELELRDLGQIAVMGAALSYAFASVWGKYFLSKHPPIMNAVGMLLSSTILMIPVVYYVDGVPSLSLSSDVWGAVLAIAIFCTAFAYFLYFEILVRAGSANLMLVTLLIPPVAIGLSYAFLNEKLGNEAGYGFLLIAIGLCVIDGRLVKWLIK